MKPFTRIMLRVIAATVAGYVAGALLFTGLAATWLLRNGYRTKPGLRTHP